MDGETSLQVKISERWVYRAGGKSAEERIYELVGMFPKVRSRLNTMFIHKYSADKLIQEHLENLTHKWLGYAA